MANPTSPREVGSYDEPGRALGVYVTGGYAYIVDECEYFAVINVSNPSRPLGVGSYKWPWSVVTKPASPQRVFVAGGYAYATQAYMWSDYGLRVIDVANPASPYEVSSDGFANDV